MPKKTPSVEECLLGIEESIDNLANVITNIQIKLDQFFKYYMDYLLESKLEG